MEQHTAYGWVYDQQSIDGSTLHNLKASTINLWDYILSVVWLYSDYSHFTCIPVPSFMQLPHAINALASGMTYTSTTSRDTALVGAHSSSIHSSPTVLAMITSFLMLVSWVC
jgi:hypothetical protein